jgi:hypothetical protein
MGVQQCSWTAFRLANGFPLAVGMTLPAAGTAARSMTWRPSPTACDLSKLLVPWQRTVGRHAYRASTYRDIGDLENEDSSGPAVSIDGYFTISDCAALLIPVVGCFTHNGWIHCKLCSDYCWPCSQTGVADETRPPPPLRLSQLPRCTTIRQIYSPVGSDQTFSSLRSRNWLERNDPCPAGN